MNKSMGMLLMGLSFLLPTALHAVEFTKAGSITRTLSDDKHYGGCMILLDTPVGNGCFSNWVSLDCKGIHVSSEAGERNYASALVAASLKKKISVRVDNEKTNDNYCVANRIDVIF